MNIDQVSQLLGVSKDTVRRRIKSGELVAEKKIGPYGAEWALPESQFDKARMIHEVIPVTRSVTVTELQAVMKKSLTEIISTVVQEETAIISKNGEEKSRELLNQIEFLKNQLALQQQSIKQLLEANEQQQQLINNALETAIKQQNNSLWTKFFR